MTQSRKLIEKSNDYCEFLKGVKKEVKKVKSHDEWKKVISTTIDCIIGTESDLAKLDMFRQRYNESSELNERLHTYLVSTKTDIGSINRFSQFMQTNQGNLKSLCFDNYAQYTDMVNGFESALPGLSKFRQEVSNIRESFKLDEKTKKFVMKINESYSNILKKFQAIEDKMNRMDFGDVVLTTQIKASFSSRVELINSLSSDKFLGGQISFLDTIDDLIDTAVKAINVSLPEYKKMTAVRNSFLEKNKQQGHAANSNGFMKGSSSKDNTDAASKTQHDQVKLKA